VSLSLYQIHVFICQNQREQNDPRGSCAQKGSERIHNKLKEDIKSLNLPTRIRINKSGCLGTCKQGVSMVIYPTGIWYGKVTENDLNEIINKTILKGEIIDRLLMPFMKQKKIELF